MTDGWPGAESWSPQPPAGGAGPSFPAPVSGRYPAGPSYPSAPPIAPVTAPGFDPFGDPFATQGTAPGAGHGAPAGRGPGRPGASRGLLTLVAVLLALVLAGGGFGVGSIVNRDRSTTTTSPTGQLTPLVQTPSDPIVSDPAEPAAAVAQALGPAIVQLENGEGLGSGVIYDASGLILTNSHVIEGSSELNVQLSDGTRLPATVLGSDPQADIAVVKVEGSNLSVARLATTKVVVGQVAIAIGSPFGLPQTVTEGIVSAIDRPVDGQAGLAINMIQTDAPINPGNSGGALANRKGEVIGINTQIYSTTGDNNGIGFAIPIETAKTVADKIVNGESLDHGYLGVTSRPLTDGSAGAQIAEVSPNAPAESAGLEVGDVITAIDGNVVKEPADLSARIIAHTPGDTIELEVTRSGQTLTITVTLGARPQSANTTTTRKR